MNWSRENERSSERATDFASIVFPTPGKSSMIRCPSAMRQRTHSSSVARGARTARSRFSTTRSTTSAAERRCDRPLRARGVGHVDESSRSTSSRTAAATTGFGAFSIVRSPSFRHDHDLVLGRIEADVRAAHVVEDEEVGASSRSACHGLARDRGRRRPRRSRPAPGRSDARRRWRRGRPSSARVRPSTRRRPSAASPRAGAAGR